MAQSRTITIDPINRIEGHLKVEVVVDEGGVVQEARCSGQLFRGFELILLGRDPRDAALLSQRVCGVCPIAHATASALCLDDAFGLTDLPENGRLMRNLIFGANFIQSHLLHFYHLAALDFVDVAAAADYAGADERLVSLKSFIGRGEVAPFLPRYEGDYRLSKQQSHEAASHYVQALEARRVAHEMAAIFGGKMPHQVGIVVGGCTENPSADSIAAFLSRLEWLRRFIDTVYLPDVLAVAQAYPDYFEIGAGVKRWLSYGGMDLETHERDLLKRRRFFPAGRVGAELSPAAVSPDEIVEYVSRSWFEDRTTGLRPSQGETAPAPEKAGGYSWLKAPRYGGEAYEVGPLARTLVAYALGEPKVKAEVDGLLGEVGAAPAALFSVLGRHAARALEARRLVEAMAGWALELKPGEPVCDWRPVPQSGRGMGLTEAPRGGNAHWCEIEDHKLTRYQLVVPTTWNASPQDDEGKPGPMEAALIGTKVKDPENPFEVVRIVRSFDPCLACSVHLLTPNGRELARCPVT